MANIVAASDCSLLVVFGNELTRENHHRVLRLWHTLKGNPFHGLTSVSPAYASLLVRFNPIRITTQRAEAHLREAIRSASTQDGTELPPSRHVRLPVCYHPDLAPDLLPLAERTGLPVDEVIRIHHQVTYQVYFLGFVPGFAYLGEVDSRIAVARHSTARKQLPAGSVGIAGRQTGVYPASLPGGWQIIGRCPQSLFDASNGELNTLLEPGDEVSFFPIDRPSFDGWNSQDEPGATR